MKVSFDFDSTLTLECVQKLASKLIYAGHDVHIVTGRFEFADNSGNKVSNTEVFDVAEELKIPIENIHFCNMKNKSEFFKENPDFIWHLDDDDIELESIRAETNVFPILRNIENNWKHQCYDTLRIIACRKSEWITELEAFLPRY